MEGPEEINLNVPWNQIVNWVSFVHMRVVSSVVSANRSWVKQSKTRDSIIDHKSILLEIENQRQRRQMAQ